MREASSEVGQMGTGRCAIWWLDVVNGWQNGER